MSFFAAFNDAVAKGQSFNRLVHEIIVDCRKVEQLAARLAHNQEVAGSNPALATKKPRPLGL